MQECTSWPWLCTCKKKSEILLSPARNPTDGEGKQLSALSRYYDYELKPSPHYQTLVLLVFLLSLVLFSTERPNVEKKLLIFYRGVFVFGLRIHPSFSSRGCYKSLTKRLPPLTLPPGAPRDGQQHLSK